MAPRPKAVPPASKPPEDAAQGRQVRDAYAAYRQKPSDATLQPLVDLVVADKNGGAACVALCKASIQQSVAVLLQGKQGQAPTAEAEVAASLLLLQAAEAAVRGVLQYKSAQMLTAAVLLFRLCIGQPDPHKRREAALRLLMQGGRKGRGWDMPDVLMHSSHSQLLPHEAIQQHMGFGSGRENWWEGVPARAWALPDTERVAGSDRWPWESDSGEWGEFLKQTQLSAAGLIGILTHDVVVSVRSMMLQEKQLQVSEGDAGSVEYRQELEALRRQHQEQQQTPLHQRFVHSQLLPLDLQQRLRRHLGLPSALEELARPAMKPIGEQLQQLQQDKAAGPCAYKKQMVQRRQKAEAVAARADAQRRMAVIIDYLRSFMADAPAELAPGDVAATNLLRHLAAATRLDVGVVREVLGELQQDKVLPQEQVRDLVQQLALALEHTKVEGTDAIVSPAFVAYRLPPPSAGGLHSYLAGADEYEAAMLRRLLREEVQEVKRDLQKALPPLRDTLQHAERARQQFNTDGIAALAALPSLATAAAGAGADVAVRRIEPPEQQGPASLDQLPLLSSLQVPDIHDGMLPDPAGQDIERFLDTVRAALPALPGLAAARSAAAGTASSNQDQDSSSQVAGVTDSSLEAPAPGSTKPLLLDAPGGGDGLPADDTARDDSAPPLPASDSQQPEAAGGDGASSPASSSGFYRSCDESPTAARARGRATPAPSEQPPGQPAEAADAEGPPKDKEPDLLEKLLCLQHEARGAAEVLSGRRAEQEVPVAYQKAKLLEAAYRRVDALLRTGVLGFRSIGIMRLVTYGPGSGEERQLLLDTLVAGWKSKAALPSLLQALTMSLVVDPEEAVKTVTSRAAKELSNDEAQDSSPETSARLSLGLFRELFTMLSGMHPDQLEGVLAGAANEGVTNPQDVIVMAEDQMVMYHQDLLRTTLDGLHLLTSRHRLTRLQAEAVLGFIQQNSPQADVQVCVTEDVQHCRQQMREAYSRVVQQVQGNPQLLSQIEAAAEARRPEALSNIKEAQELFEYRQQHTGAQLRAQLIQQQQHAWAVCLLYLPLAALERLHAFVCLQVGASFSDPWEMDNTVQADNFLRKHSAGMLVQLPAPQQQLGGGGGGSDAGPSGAGSGGVALQVAPLCLLQDLKDVKLSPMFTAEVDPEQLVRWFALWAVNARIDAAAMAAAAEAAAATAPAPPAGGAGSSNGSGGGRLARSKRGGGATAGSSAAGGQAGGGAAGDRAGAPAAAATAPAELHLLDDDDARRQLVDLAVPLAEMGYLAALVQMSEELAHVMQGVRGALPCHPEAWREAASGIQEQVEGVGPADLAAAGRHMLTLLRCCTDAGKTLDAARKCLTLLDMAIQQQVGGLAAARDVEMDSRMQALQREVEACCVGAGAASLDQWLQLPENAHLHELADRLLELEQVVAAAAAAAGGSSGDGDGSAGGGGDNAGDANVSRGGDEQLMALMLPQGRSSVREGLCLLEEQCGGLHQGLQQLSAVQEACYIRVRKMMRGVFADYAMLAPLDNVVRCMVAHVLPHTWRKQLDKAAEAARKSACDSLLELLDEEEEQQQAAAAAGKKKKKKGKKGGAAAASTVASAAAQEQQAEAAESAVCRTGEAQVAAVAAAAAAEQEQQEGLRQQTPTPAAAAGAQEQQQEGFRQVAQQMAVVAEPRQRQRQQQPPTATSYDDEELPPAPAPAAQRGVQAERAGDATRSSAADTSEQQQRQQRHSMEALLAASAGFDWSKVEGADEDGGAATSAAHTAAPADGWHKATPGGGSKQQQAAVLLPKAAAPGRATSATGGSKLAAAAPAQRWPGDKARQRIVGWDGAWVCKCEQQHSVMQDCKTCASPMPCRNYLRGLCKLGKDCRFSHPPFDMQRPHGPPPSMHQSEVVVSNPSAQSSKPQWDESVVRVVSWKGDWVCPCGDSHRMHHSCDACHYPSPCRDWLRGKCQYGATCKHKHPPFDLPAARKPPEHERVVSLTPDAPIWRSAAAAAGAARSRAPGAAAVSSSGASHQQQQQRQQAGVDLQAPGMASAAAALAEQLGVDSMEQLADLLTPEEMQASLLLMQEQQQQRQQQQRAPNGLFAASGQPVPGVAAAERLPSPAATAAAAVAGAGPKLGSLGFSWQTPAADPLQRQPSWVGGSSSNSWEPGGGTELRAAGRSGSTGDVGGSSNLRVVASDGSWVCPCGKQLGGNRRQCTNRQCPYKTKAPCRNWMMGACGKEHCRDPHPPFDASGNWSADVPVVRAVLWEGAPLYRPPPRLPGRLQAAPLAAVEQQAVAPPNPLPVPPPAAQPAAAPPPAAAVVRGWDPFAGPSVAAATALGRAADTRLSPTSRLPLPTAVGLARPLLPVAPDMPLAAAAPGLRYQAAGTQLGSMAAGGMAAAAGGMAAAAGGMAAAAGGMAAAAGGSSGGDEEELLQLLQGLGIGHSFGAAVVAGSASSLTSSGLRDETAQYHCFLSVIIQCVWRCVEFRRQVMMWGPEECRRDRVVAALHSLFCAFAAEEQQRRQAGPLEGTAARRGIVNLTEMRQALSALPGQRYRVGEMNDAGEVLLAIYERAMSVSQVAETAVNLLFGLPVGEYVQCSSCRSITQQSAYTRYFYSTQAAALQTAHSFSPHLAMGNLLKLIDQQHLKTCNEEVGGCGLKNSVVHTLRRLPLVFTLHITWKSHHETSSSIAATLAALDEQVDLCDFYAAVQRGAQRYRLSSMVCYHEAHYLAFVCAQADPAAWRMYDQSSISSTGSWEAVRRQCEAGRIQPVMLFYEAT